MRNAEFLKQKLSLFVCVIMILCGTYLFLVQILDIHTLWTPVGFVDTWPLYDRLMKYDTSQLNLEHYLLDPHVHPHLIVYLLYLIDVTYGTGRQLIPHFATLVSIIGLTAVIWFVVKRYSLKFLGDQSQFNLGSCAFFIGTFVLLTGLSEATIIPFQCVVTVTRFTYITLLAVLVICQFSEHKIIHAVALAISTIVMTFYASAGVFAVEIILLHALFFRKWRWLLASMLPLMSYFFLIWRYTSPSAEASALSEVIRHVDFATCWQLILGVLCYYANVLIAGWPWSISIDLNGSMVFAIFLGCVVCVSTVAWAAYTLFNLFRKNWQGQQSFALINVTSCFMALLSFFVFASAIAAALLWVVRLKILGAAMGMPSYYAVLTSSRYAAFASLAWMVFLFICLTINYRIIGRILSLIIFVIIMGVSFNSLSQLKMEYNLSVRNNIELAATALLMDMSPTEPEANAVWPGVAADWYWPKELLKVTAYLKNTKISYAYDLPSLGVTSSQGAKAMIVGYEVQSVAEKPEICRLNGASFDLKTNFWAPQRFFAVTQSDGKVVGYALHEGVSVKGHVFCSAASKNNPLFLLTSFRINPSALSTSSYY